MNRETNYALVILVVLLSGTIFGDYLKVSRKASLKAEPNRNAVVILKVERGTLLQLLNDGNQENGYYLAETVSAEKRGYIYRTLARRYPGDIPQAEPEIVTRDPLSDTTGILTNDQIRFASRHLKLGKPQAVYERVREGYVLAQCGRLKIPLWVQYEISRDELGGPAERRDNFRPDTSIPHGYRAEKRDYMNSGYARGHMAPAEDMDRSEKVMAESFFLSNMAPQIGPGFNGAIWKTLEEAIRGWVEQRGTLLIITGPIFAAAKNENNENFVKYKVIGDNHVAVPTHFYKIVVDANEPANISALAFKFPHQKLTVDEGHKISDFLCTIDEIEKDTGLDFLSALPDDVEKRVEEKKASAIW